MTMNSNINTFFGFNFQYYKYEQMQSSQTKIAEESEEVPRPKVLGAKNIA